MATNLLVFDKGDLDDIFQPKAKESVKRSDISIKVGNIDITNRYEPTNGFDQINFNTGYIFQGQDIRHFFQRKGYLPQYFLKADNSTINEGETVNFNITVIDVPDNTNICFETSSNSDFVTPTGTVTIKDSKGSFSLTAKNDLTTEGTEIINVFLKRCDTGKVVTTTNLLVTVKDTSRTPPTYKLTPDKTVVDEGGVVKITVNTTDVDDNTILYYDTSSNSDFTNPTGTVTITGGVGSFNLNARNDLTTEGVEIITVNLRTDSTNGTIVKTSDQITINDTSRTPPTYKVTPSVLAINEGGSVTLTVTTTDVDNGVILYYDTSSNSDFVTATGSITIASSRASFVLIAKEDLTTEGVETFTVNIRTSSLTGPIVCTSSSITINDTSRTPPTYAITANKTSVNEGESVTFTVTTTDVDNGTALFYDTSSNSDFVNPSGSIIIRNNTGSFTLDVKNDVTTEGAETFVANLRIGSITGTTVRTSASITINDTSTSIPTYDISASKSSVDEGSSVELCVTTTDTNNGTKLYYDVGIFGGDINTETDINIIVDSSGSNSPTANVLSKMISSGLLRQYLLPYYNNNTAIYDQRVKFLAIGSERTFSLDMLGRAGSASCKRLINLVFQDETDGVYNNTNNASYNQDMTALRTRLGNYTPGFFAGAVFQVAGANQFKTFLEQVKAGTGAFTSLNLKDKPEVTMSYGVTDGGTQQYYVNLIIDTLKSLNFKLPGGSGSTVIGEDFILPTGVTTPGGVTTVQNNKSCFTLDIKADSLTEGTESFVVNIRTGSATGPVVRTSSSITINDTSLTPPSYKITADRSVVNEGGTVKLTLNTERVANGTILYYSTSRDDDFLNPNGFATIINNTAVFELNVKNDLTSEGVETFVVNVRVGSSSGSIVTTSSSITIYDTSPTPPTYKITADKSIVNEGGVVVFTVETERVGNGTVLFYNTNRDDDFVTPSGSVTINNNGATFSLNVKNDLTSEGTETFVAYLRTVSGSGTIVTTSATITICDTSLTPPTFKTTPDVTTINEGSEVTFTVTTTNVANNTVLYYDATNSNDIVTPTGSFTVVNNTATFKVAAKADLLTEGTETFTVNIRTVSNTGSIVHTSTVITILDTSLTVPTYNTSPNVVTISEGGEVTFTVTTTNVANNTVLYYDTSNTHDIVTPTGSFTIVNNTATFKIAAKADSLTEGLETFTVNLRTVSNTGTIVHTSTVITILDTSTSPPTYKITPRSTVVNEGTSLVFDIETTNVSNNTVLYYDLAASSTATGSDFVITNTAPAFINNTTNINIAIDTSGSMDAAVPELRGVIGSTKLQNYLLQFYSNASIINQRVKLHEINTERTLLMANLPGAVDSTRLINFAFQDESSPYASANTLQADTNTLVNTVTSYSYRYYEGKIVQVTGDSGFKTLLQNIKAAQPLRDIPNVNMVYDIDRNGSIDYFADIIIRELEALKANFISTYGTSGNVTVNNNTASFTYNIAADQLTEGAETFFVNLRTISNAGKVVKTSPTVTITDTSPTPATYASTPDKYAVNEGDVVTFDVKTTNVTNGTVLYYDTSSDSDFDNPKGSVVINKNSGVVKLNVKNDFTTEDVAALCTGIVGLPASINGINVTASQTGAVSVYNTNFNGVSRSTCNGQVVMPPGVAMVGKGTKPYTYTLRFSEPVNNIGLAINGTGPTAETFTITTDTEKPVITAGTNCFSKIEDNKIISGDQSAPTQWYAVSHHTWSSWLNELGIWIGPQVAATNSFSATFNVLATGLHTFECSVDDTATITITKGAFSHVITLNAAPEWNKNRTHQVQLDAGQYNINVSVHSIGGPAGIGIRIKNPTGGVIWNTRDWAATHGGGGGVFYIKSRTPYKSITVTGNGSADGSVIGICSNINTESFTMRLRAGSETSPVVHTSTSVLINDTSLTAPVYNITPNKSSVNEGGNVIFTVTTANVPNNTVVYYDTDVTPDLINDTTDFNITIDTSGSMNAAVPELKGILNNTKLRNYLLRFYSNANILTKRVKIHEVNKERTFQMIDRKGANDSTRLINFAFQDESSPYSNANTLQSDVTALLAIIDDYPYQYYDGTVFQVTGYSAFKTLLQTTKAKQFVNTPNVNMVYDINKDGNSDYFADVIIKRLEELRAQYIASDFVLPAGILTLTGSLTIQNSTASFTAYVKADAATEGTESFNVNLRTTNSNGPVVATSSSVTIVDSSKTPAPTYDITPNKTVVNEGEVVVFNIATTRIPDNTILYYTLSRNDVSSGTNNRGANSGSVTITNNKASFSVYVDDDKTTEGYQTFTASLRTGSIGGTVVSTSEAVGINDTSTTPITYSIQPNKSQIKEGETVVFNVATTGVANGTVLNYEITRYLGVVSTNVKNYTPASFGTFPAGKYVIKYVSGAWSAWNSGDKYLFDSFTLKAGKTDIHIGGGDVYTSARVEDIAQNWSADEPYSKVFQHPGGDISLVIADTPLTDNRHHPNGTPKYALYALSDLPDVTNEFGTVTIQGNNASINITAKSDGTPEGYQEIRANLRKGGASGRIVATSNAVGVRDNQINSAFYFGVKQTSGDCWFTRAFNTQHPNLTFRVNTNMAGTSRFDFTGTNRKDYKGLQMDSGRNDITINNIQLIVNKEAVYTWNLGLVLSTNNNINGSSTQNFAVTYNAAASPKATFTKTGNGVTWIEGNINLEIPPKYVK